MWPAASAAPGWGRYLWDQLEDHPVRARLVAGVVILVLLALSTLLIYQTGGTSRVYVHVIYVPILLGAFTFGVAGGVVVGIAAGLLCGPWMPIDTATGTMQSLEN